MATLSIPELRKRENFTKFRQKIVEKEDFCMPGDGTCYKIGYKNLSEHTKFIKSVFGGPSSGTLVQLENWYKNTKGFPAYYANKQISVTWAKMHKDSSFGGRQTTGTEKEDIQLSRLIKLINESKDEIGEDSITVKFKGKSWRGIAGAESTPGTPKSDFHLTGVDGKAKVFISHKDGKGVKAFGQWGGITKQADGKNPSDMGVISKDKEVLDFVEAIKARFPVGSQFPKGVTLARRIRSPKLKNRSVYGPSYTPGGTGSIDNCDMLLQGTIDLKRSGKTKTFIISADGSEHLNGDTMTGQAAPTLMVMFKGVNRKDFGIIGARFSVYPVGGRSNILEPWPDDMRAK
tara:strand:+ start:5349 stop:6386 length:1038 start_codon:yes stop_codon:yes gene_type:complete